MSSTFQNMPPHSRIWIYQSNRKLNEKEVAEIEIKAENFIDQWTSHGKTMNACIEIFYKLFIVVAVDEQTAPASGCGIDKSVHFIQQLEKYFSITLLNRTLVAYKKNDKLYTCSLAEFEKLIESGSITENTIVFNNLINTKAEMESNWEIALKQSWHSKFLPHKNILHRKRTLLDSPGISFQQ